MCEQTLKAKPLPAELIVKKFVKGEDTCDPERYMLEFINQSSFFAQKSLGGQFTQPPHQRNKQCDFVADCYSLDLKLLVSQTYMQGISEMSYGKQMLAPGVVSTTLPHGKKANQKALRIHSVLRQYTVEQLSELRDCTRGKTDTEKAVVAILKILETEKNLLLFFPYCFDFGDEGIPVDGIERIIKVLNRDFQHVLEYRNKAKAEFDTFFAFLFDGAIVFLEGNNKSFTYADSVPLKASPIFQKLASVVSTL